jgi:UDP-N-acetylmuramate dehydrogenase
MLRVEQDKSLLHFNTFGVNVRAKLFVEIESADEFKELVGGHLVRERRLILGGGSNILFTRDFDGLVIKNSITGIQVLREDDAHVWVRAGAGEPWHAFVLHCIEHGWAGLENLSLIPGQVGAAPIQNIGAYGVEMEPFCESVETVHAATAESVIFTHAECEFGYRDSIFKSRRGDEFLVTAVVFRLDKVPRFEVGYGDLRRTLDEMGVRDLTIRAVSDAVIRIRTSKLPDPAVLGNAGSFFKNPSIPREHYERLAALHPGMPSYPQRDGTVKLPAGWLIEQCSWKGRIVGRAGVHARQALVLVNHGGATGDEILRLALDIQRAVRDRFGVELVPEVNVV